MVVKRFRVHSCLTLRELFAFVFSKLLFIGVRQLITLSLGKATEIFVIDFLSIRRRFTIRLLGPWVTLFILQARGWPFLLFMWAIFDFALLSGKLYGGFMITTTLHHNYSSSINTIPHTLLLNHIIFRYKTIFCPLALSAGKSST
jgi:hypothetical protein